MKHLTKLSGLAILAVAAALGQDAPAPTPRGAPAALLAPGEEKFLANVRQLTFGGQNAEAYWSADGRQLIFQSDEGALPCDQIFIMVLPPVPAPVPAPEKREHA